MQSLTILRFLRKRVITVNVGRSPGKVLNAEVVLSINVHDLYLHRYEWGWIIDWSGMITATSNKNLTTDRVY